MLAGSWRKKRGGSRSCCCSCRRCKKCRRIINGWHKNHPNAQRTNMHRMMLLRPSCRACFVRNVPSARVVFVWGGCGVMFGVAFSVVAGAAAAAAAGCSSLFARALMNRDSKRDTRMIFQSVALIQQQRQQHLCTQLLRSIDWGNLPRLRRLLSQDFRVLR